MALVEEAMRIVLSSGMQLFRRTEALLTTQNIIIQFFYLVDDRMGNLSKYSQAKLYPSGVVTIGILFAL